MQNTNIRDIPSEHLYKNYKMKYSGIDKDQHRHMQRKCQ